MKHCDTHTPAVPCDDVSHSHVKNRTVLCHTEKPSYLQEERHVGMHYTKAFTPFLQRGIRVHENFIDKIPASLTKKA